MKIKLRKANMIDCKDVFKWRNDPKTRQMSFDTKEIDFKDHEEWFKKSLKEPDRHMFIAEDGIRKIGVVRIDRLNADAGEININIAPGCRGKGYGSRLIKLATDKMIKTGKFSFIIARIKVSNVASIKAFEKAGYRELMSRTEGKHGRLYIS